MSTSTALDTKTVTKLKEVKMWRVVLLNDDYTPIDFVIAVLVQLFHKSEDDAANIAQNIHERGRGVAGVYIKEISLQKASDTCQAAKAHGHPLKAVAEEC